MKRKLSLLLTTAVILSALFTGCTSTQNKEEDKDITKKEETLSLKGERFISLLWGRNDKTI